MVTKTFGSESESEKNELGSTTLDVMAISVEDLGPVL
jgi:hypothetical protein